MTHFRIIYMYALQNACSVLHKGDLQSFLLPATFRVQQKTGFYGRVQAYVLTKDYVHKPMLVHPFNIILYIRYLDKPMLRPPLSTMSGTSFYWCPYRCNATFLIDQMHFLSVVIHSTEYKRKRIFIGVFNAIASQRSMSISQC